jgi:hypothetical protein
MLSRIKAWAHELKGTVTQTDGGVSGRPILKSRHSFDSLDALKGGLASVQCFEVVGRTPATARRKNCRSSRADRFDAVYLRAAQAYMLISMPTGTSTILGVFQVIPSSREIWRELHAEVEPRTTPDVAQVRKIERRTPDSRYFSPAQCDFSLGQGPAAIGQHAAL